MLTETARCVVVVSSCRVFVVVTLTRCVLSSCRPVVVAVVLNTTAHRIQLKVWRVVDVGRSAGDERGWRRGRCGEENRCEVWRVKKS